MPPAVPEIVYLIWRVMLPLQSRSTSVGICPRPRTCANDGVHVVVVAGFDVLEADQNEPDVPSAAADSIEVTI
jgi:hypothetical protein